MPNDRRLRIEGGTYFFTLCLEDRNARHLTEHVDLLRRAFAETLRARPVRIDAIVVLPDHLHMVWTLPPGDADFSERIRQIKGRFTHWLGVIRPNTPGRARPREAGIWQRRFRERAIRSPQDRDHHLAYCWHDPVRHGLVRYPGEWVHSSFHRDLRLGRVPEGWQDDFSALPHGERRLTTSQERRLVSPGARA